MNFVSKLLENTRNKNLDFTWKFSEPDNYTFAQTLHPLNTLHIDFAKDNAMVIFPNGFGLKSDKAVLKQLKDEIRKAIERGALAIAGDYASGDIDADMEREAAEKEKQAKEKKDNYSKKMIWPQFIYNIGWFFGNIKQTLSWLPIIWNDHQWDHYSIIDLLEKKLSLMRSFYSSDKPNAEGTDEVADQINEVLVVIKRIKEMEYSMNASNKFEEKFPDYDWTIKTIPRNS